MSYKYYLVFQHRDGTDKAFITRDSPLDSEKAILEEHENLERELGRPVVLIRWKRID